MAGVAAPSRSAPAEPPEPLVDDGWAPDPLEPDGAAELRRRLLARPRHVPRTELEGHVGLSARELFELGCTLAPLGPLDLGAAVGRRVLVVVGAFLLALGLAGGLSSTLAPLLDGLLGAPRNPDLMPGGQALAMAGLFLAAAAGGRELLLRSVRALRTRAAERRRVRPGQGRQPAQDPQARTTVAVVRGPDVIRVQLLWLRADPADPAQVELRTLAEQRVPRDEPARAEEAVVRLSEVALRADAARGLVAEHGTGALAASASRVTVETVPAVPSGTGPADAPGPRGGSPRTPVRDGWELDPLTEEGEAELARRLCLAEPARWSADALAPLVRAGAATGPVDPAGLPAWPSGGAVGSVATPVLDPKVLRRVGAATVAVWFFAMAGSEDPAAATSLVGYGALAVALTCGAVLWWSAHRTPGQRLLRTLRGAASAPPRALEQGLPGTGGRFLVARGAHRDGERLALLHVRPVPDDGGAGAVEVRRLAWRDVKRGGAVTPHEVAHQLRLVADAAEFLGARGGGSARQLRRLVAGLGRAGARTAERSGLAREPLVWLAATVPPLLVVSAVRQTVRGTWLEDGLTNRLLSFSWPLAIALILVWAARRIRDPWAA